jgi:hypothetical protein
LIPRSKSVSRIRWKSCEMVETRHDDKVEL